MTDPELKSEIEKFLEAGPAVLIPQLSIDCVIFCFYKSRLKVLLLQGVRQKMFFLPSGFIFQEEDLDAAALRNLKERTGLDQVFLQQFHAFGKASRYYPAQLQSLFSSLDIDSAKAEWLFRRFITIGYYALVDFQQVTLTPDVFTKKYHWADVNDLPLLYMDHAEMIQKALETLKKDIQTQPIGLQLLPNTFTLPELQSLYETVLDRKIDRRNFRKKMLQSHILEPLDKQKVVKGHRSPHLYRFNQEQYEQSLHVEVKMGF